MYLIGREAFRWRQQVEMKLLLLVDLPSLSAIGRAVSVAPDLKIGVAVAGML